MSWLDQFPAQLAQLDAQHLRRVRREVLTDAAHEGGTHLIVDGQPLLAFCSNDYLGLAQNPRLKAVAAQAAQELGVGSGASALVSGYGASDAALERELAAHVGLPAALYYSSGYMANVGTIPALVDRGDAVFADKLNHACLIDGVRLSRADVQRYPSGDLQALEQQLARSTHRRKLIVTDAVFSMDGHIADLPALLALAERYDALLMIDDAHGFGVLGDRGQGSIAHWGLLDAQGQALPEVQKRLLYMATLGKAAGVMGAFVAGRADLVEWLVQKSRSYIFATSPPPILSQTLRESLRIIAGEPQRRANLRARIAQLREGLTHICASQPERGWRLLPSETAIQPLIVGSNETALSLMDRLKSQGLWVPAIRPPTVPAGTARLRIALSVGHTATDIERLLQALA
jgi:8-amino-7-oxononanoate synthase